ncbi:3342_t:CDS:2, partial [Cetraspora pellucida]
MNYQNSSDGFVLPYSNNLATESYNTASLRTARRRVMAYADNFSFSGTMPNHEINPLSSVSSHVTTHKRIYSVDNDSRINSHTSLASTLAHEISTLNSDSPLLDPSSPNPDNNNVIHDTSSPLFSPSVRSSRQFTHIHKKRLSRTMQHISSFIKLTVNISPTISFPVTIEKTYTVERLARQIEAEYAFKYGGIEERSIHEPLEVGLLYDVSMVALRFRDLVGDVLEHGCGRCSNGIEYTDLDFEFQDFDLGLDKDFMLNKCRESRRFSLPIISNNDSLQNNDTSVPLSQTTPISDPHLSLSPLPISQSSQSNFRSILSNLLALNYFQKFSIREFSVENLLFWLDIELFAAGTCEIEDNYFEDQQSAIIHAKYIYLTYIGSNAPLQVNLSDEIRKDITWPLDDDCIVERNMFDEAQEAVYQLMKGHSFTRFESSPEWKECEKIKMDDSKEYEDREMTEPLGRYFRPNMSLMLAITMALDDSCNPAPTSHHYKEQTLHSILSQYFPETILLDNNGKRRSQNITDKNSSDTVSLNGYFDSENRMTNAQKMRRIKKERKLRWVFGEKIGRIKDQPVVLSGEFRYGDGKLRFEDEDHDAMSMFSNDSESRKFAKEIWIKKKRKDKLEFILGRGLKDRNSFKDSLPRSLDNNVTPNNNDRNNIHSFSLNVLSPDDRRRMVKKNKKLQVMLGEALDENMIRQTITIPATQSPSLLFNNKNRFNSDVGISNKPYLIRRASDSMIISPLPSPNNIITPPTTPPTYSDENDDQNCIKHQPSNSVTSFTNSKLTHLTAANKDTKEYRRKKLQKLYNFLGEHVPIDIVLGEKDHYKTSLLPDPLPDPPKRKSKGRPNSLSFTSKKNSSSSNIDAQATLTLPRLSAVDRKRHLHRAIKLEKLFGEAPPQDLIFQNLRSRNFTDSISSIDIHRRSIMSLEYLMENDRDAMYDLIDYMADSDGENNDDDYEEEFVAPLSAPVTPNPSSSLKFNLPQTDQKQAKLKGIRKLSHFFGATYGQMFPDQVLGELLGDLEREIREEARQNEEVDKAVVAGLMGQLEELRAKSGELGPNSDDENVTEELSLTDNESDEIHKRLELNRKKRDLKPES